jgi:3-oxoacyl-[acyl-carrier-protein] synthase-1
VFQRVHFAGAALHTALGAGLEANLDALAGPIAPPRAVPVPFAGQCEQVPYRLLADAPLADIEQRLYRVLDAVIDAALRQAGLDAVERAGLALLVGSSSADISVSEARFQRELAQDPAALAMAHSSSIGNLANRIRHRFALRGADYSVNTACTASANALLYAAQLVERGDAPAALVVGVELFNTITAMGFAGLELIARGSMKPFDAARDGLVPGEAVAALVVTARPRSAFRLLGGATLCDTHSISAANPDGSSVAEVMRAALDSATLGAGDIAALKTHGTASLLNDEAEVAGMRRLFGAELPPLCALKPFIGHTFGACGLGELLLFCGAARRGFLAPTPGVCAEPSDLGVRLNQRPQPLAPGRFLLNYFGFGGNNTSLVVGNA